jgi:hypothetical protein
MLSCRIQHFQVEINFGIQLYNPKMEVYVPPKHFDPPTKPHAVKPYFTIGLIKNKAIPVTGRGGL